MGRSIVVVSAISYSYAICKYGYVTRGHHPLPPHAGFATQARDFGCAVLGSPVLRASGFNKTFNRLVI